MILRNLFRMGKENPYPDSKLGVHWYNSDLYDDEYKVGYVTVFPAEQVGTAKWQAHPFWNESPQWFLTQEEAKAWLVAMYKMGGANERPKQRQRVHNGRTTL